MQPSGRGVEIDPLNSPGVKKSGITYRHMSLLPSCNLIGRPTGDFFTLRWIVPADEKRNILWNFNLFRREGKLGVARDWLEWIFFKSWAHDWLFSEQDK